MSKRTMRNTMTTKWLPCELGWRTSEGDTPCVQQAGWVIEGDVYVCERHFVALRSTGRIDKW